MLSEWNSVWNVWNSCSCSLFENITASQTLFVSAIYNITNVNSSRKLTPSAHQLCAHIWNEETLQRQSYKMLIHHHSFVAFKEDVFDCYSDWCFACRGADDYHSLHNIVFHSLQSRCGLSWSLSQLTIKTLLLARVSFTA